MRLASLLLKVGLLVPVFFFGALVAGGLMWPGYDHMTRQIAELGTVAAPAADLFNKGLLATGAATVIAALGMFLGMRKLGSGTILPLLTGIAVAAWGASMLLAGLHPMPDPLHGAYQLGWAVHVAPVLMFLSLSDRGDMSGLKTLLILCFLAMTALIVLIMNLGGLNLIKPEPLGLWERAYTLATIPWIAVAALCIDQRLAAKIKKSR